MPMGAMVDVSRELVAYVASLLAARRRTRGTRRRSRALSCGKQALFALVWFRKREDLTVLAAGFGISRATGYRYRDEAVAVLAVEAPELSDALRRQGPGKVVNQLVRTALSGRVGLWAWWRSPAAMLVCPVWRRIEMARLRSDAIT